MNNVDAIKEGLDRLKNIDNEVEIVNLVGTHDTWPKCPDDEFWIDYYVKKHGKTDLCSVHREKCNKLNGGHVAKVEDILNGNIRVYLVPLCDECNVPTNDKIMKVDECDLLDVSSICDYKEIKHLNKEVEEKVIALKKYFK